MQPAPAAYTDSLPIPGHNFPNLIQSTDCDVNWHPFVDEFNCVKLGLSGIQAKMWDGEGSIAGTAHAQLLWLNRMKKILDQFLPRLASKLAYLPLVESHHGKSTTHYAMKQEMFL